MTVLDRRGFIAAAAATLLTRAARAQPADVPLQVRIDLNGTSYDYDQSTGTDLGDFVSPIGGFTQRCIRVQNSNLPLTVFFRPDRGSGRLEVVFELGRLFSGPPAHLGAYTATIMQGGAVLASLSVPAHYWFSRWRWQSSPRPVVGDVAGLIAQGLLPPYVTGGSQPTPVAPLPATPTSGTPEGSCTVAPSNPGHPMSIHTPVSCIAATPSAVLTATTSLVSGALQAVAAVPYEIMGLAGLQPYMPLTGERDDIGLVTEAQGQYIVSGDAAALAQLRAQAEAAGTEPWHMRDENTGAPIDFRAYPMASWYRTSELASPLIATIDAPVVWDTAHMPALSYVPYMLTGDPYHLEDLQFMANGAWGALPPDYRPTIGQTRAFAWHMRSLSQAARVTPAQVPAWLLPQDYWLDFLSRCRSFAETNYVNDPNPLHAVFRSTSDLSGAGDEGYAAPEGCWIDPWQEEFLAAVTGWMISMGFREWQSFFDWKIGSTIARTGTTSGWIRAYSTPYRVILRDTKTDPLAGSWAEAWTITQRHRGYPYSDPNTWVDSDMTYLHYSRGALIYAVRLGNQAAVDNLNWATSQLNARGWNIPAKWRLEA